MSALLEGAHAMRAVLERALGEALVAVDVERRVHDATLRAVPRATDVRIVAVGKAAATMARGAIAALGDRVVGALVIVPDGTSVRGLGPRVEIVRAAHPLPDARSVVAAERALAFARDAGRARDGVLLALVSGGASALVCAPYRTKLARKVDVVRALLHARATIAEINLVRRHASRIKGGGLLRAARPSCVVSLLVSDVIGGAAWDVASGPTLPDPTTRAGARAVLARYAAGSLPLRESLSPSSRDARRSFARVVARPHDLATAMAAALVRAGVRARTLPACTRDVEWFAARYASQARSLAPGEAIVRAAEPILRVDVARPGRGGRSSHLATLVAATLPRDVTFLAVASDGVDGASGAAGAIVDASRWSAIDPRDVAAALADFDTGALHARAHTAVAGGPSGQNLADIHVLVRRRSR